jgi:hypothetical protein
MKNIIENQSHFLADNGIIITTVSNGDLTSYERPPIEEER